MCLLHHSDFDTVPNKGAAIVAMDTTQGVNDFSVNMM